MPSVAPAQPKRGTASDEIGSGAAIIQAPPRSANVAVGASAAPGRRGRRGAILRAVKTEDHRRACGSRAWHCHAGFGRARLSQDFARTSLCVDTAEASHWQRLPQRKTEKEGRRTDNTGPCREGFLRTRVAGLEPRTARRSRLVGSPTRCCTTSCLSGPSRGFSEICGFRGAVMWPLPAVRRLRRRSRTQPFHPRPGLRAINPCTLYPSKRLLAGRYCRLAGPGRPAGSSLRILCFEHLKGTCAPAGRPRRRSRGRLRFERQYRD